MGTGPKSGQALWATMSLLGFCKSGLPQDRIKQGTGEK